MKKVLLLQTLRFNPEKPEDSKASLYAVPFTEIATEFRYIFNEKYGCNWCNVCSFELRY